VRNETSDPDVLAKAAAARSWRTNASDRAGAHDGKPWLYVVIPHELLSENVSTVVLLQRAEIAAPSA
jgi:type III restriction enzyme